MNATEMMEDFGDGGYDEESNDYMIESLSREEPVSNKGQSIEGLKMGVTAKVAQPEEKNHRQNEKSDIIF